MHTSSQNGAVGLVSSSSSCCSKSSECILRARRYNTSRLRSQRTTTQAQQKHGKMRDGRCRSSKVSMSAGENDEKDGDATGKREKNTRREPSSSSLPSWKVVSESPWISDGRSNATEGKPSVEEEPKDGIPIGAPSRRRATKMIFTCNKCGTRLSLSLSLSRVQDFDLYHSLSFFLSFLTPGIRTERRVNKDNLTAGTTWVQCGNPSCSVWHKIVDNLGLVYECSDDILE